jgi:GTP-binding protein HflX
MGKLQLIRKYGQLLSEEYQDEGVKVTGYIPMEWIEKI